MLLPQFIATFANGTKAPWIRGEAADIFAQQIQDKVKAWVQLRKDQSQS
jgi:hypothetical protein